MNTGGEGGTADNAGGDGAKKKRRRRRRGKKPGDGAVGTAGVGNADAGERPAPAGGRATFDDDMDSGARERGDDAAGGGDAEGGDKKRRRRRRGKSKGEGGGGGGGGRGAAGEIEPKRHRTVTTQFMPEVFDTGKTFRDLGLKGEVLEGLDRAGFQHPTHIQAKLIPVALTGQDILGQAKTGTGKTLAFSLPLLHMVTPGERFSALVLGPTRELAIQIRQDVEEVGGFTGLSAAAVYGGQSINVQAEKLARGPEIIVGTPGRIMDMAERGYLHFNNFRFVVLDEVDRMFDFGFRDDMKKILSKCPKDRQTIFVSATMLPEIEKLATKYMTSPEKLVVAAGSLTVELVKQSYLSVEGWDKKRLLAHLLTHEEPALTLVFCRMKRTVDKVSEYLDKHGIDAHPIHGDMSQAQRNKVMEKFRSGRLSVLVASDLASRGIDVEGITHVVNFDLPDDPDAYVHRIGRTARAGREGTAWSLVTKAEGKLLSEIENLINAEIPEKLYPDFERSERPEGYRDEVRGGRRPIEIEGVEREAKNRYAAPEIPAALDAEELAKKFPGGIVPKKLPPKMMRGRVKGRG